MKEGAKECIVGHHKTILKKLANEKNAISYVVAVITQSEDLVKYPETIKSTFINQLDILVNNTGWAPVISLFKNFKLLKAFRFDVGEHLLQDKMIYLYLDFEICCRK